MKRAADIRTKTFSVLFIRGPLHPWPSSSVALFIRGPLHPWPSSSAVLFVRFQKIPAPRAEVTEKDSNDLPTLP